MSVEAINVRQRMCLMSSGKVWPISVMLDADGEETENDAEAAFLVVGPCRDETRSEFWVTLDRSEFKEVQSC